jgi:hypothetical protein
VPSLRARHPPARSCSTCWAANVAATAERCPRPIMRVTRAAVVTRPSRPIDRTTIAMMTSMTVKPHWVFIYRTTLPTRLIMIESCTAFEVNRRVVTT